MPGPDALNRRLRDLAHRYVEAMVQEHADRVVSAALFGSVARGEATPHSDIDLLFVITGLPRSQLPRHDLLVGPDARVEPLLAALRREGVTVEVRPILKTPEEAARPTLLYLDLVEDAELIVDRGGFLRGILEDFRRSLARLGARRVRRGDTWYWDLKPDYRPGEIFEL